MAVWCTHLGALASREADEPLLPHHDLIDERALAQGYELGLVKGRCDLAPRHSRQPFDTYEEKDDDWLIDWLIGWLVD